jgi:uncharacterized membrane protein
MWCAPYLTVQYFVIVLGLVLFTFSGAFFFSVLFKRQALSALAAIALLAAYLAWRGVGGYRKAYESKTVETDILILFLLIAGIFIVSLLAFRVREF